MQRAAWTACVLAAVCAVGCLDSGDSRLQDLAVVVEIAPERLDFGRTLAGTRVDRVVTLHNRGTAPVRVRAL